MSPRLSTMESVKAALAAGVERRVIERERAKMADTFERRLVKIVRLVSRIKYERPSWGAGDLGVHLIDLDEIAKLARLE